jgi:DNA-binding LytR/AlgR family response regulator
VSTPRLSWPAPWAPGESGDAGASAPRLLRAQPTLRRVAPVPALPQPPDCIPVRSCDRIAIVRVQAIVRLEADDNYVRIWADRMYLHKETLSGLCARLPGGQFLRVHRSHAVRVDCVRELVPRLHGEYLLRLANGVELVSGRSYRNAIRTTFGLD